MISMRAMGVENDIDEELDRIQQLRDQIVELVPADAEENYDWLNVRDENGNREWEPKIDKLKGLCLSLLDATYNLEAYEYTRTVLQS